MKGFNQVWMLCLVFAFMACQKEEFVGIEEEEISSEKAVTLNSGFNAKSKTFDSKTVSTKTAYGTRSHHSSVVFQNKMWVIAGVGDEGLYADVWFSENGTSWDVATKKAPFFNRYSHAATVFENKIWVVGGTTYSSGTSQILNDVWSSVNGKDWKTITTNANFTQRVGHTLTTFKERMWIIGGSEMSGNALSDKIRSSADGENWLLVNSDPPFGNRWMHSTLVFDNKLWVIGGYGTSVPGPESNSGNEVWYSENGYDWILATENAGFIGRWGHTAVSDANYMWVIGGKGSKGYHHLNDIWRSEDGIDWEKVSVSELPHKRGMHTSLFFKDKIWAIDGWQYNGTSPGGTLFFNSISNIWYMEP